MCVFLFIIFILIYGLYGMKKVDNFIINDQEFKKSKILIYGNDRRIKNAIDMCNNFNKSYDFLDNNSINKINSGYNLLLVLSNDDLDNLMICLLGKKWCNIKEIISICNEYENKKIYEDYGIIINEFNDIQNDEFLTIMEEKIKNV